MLDFILQFFNGIIKRNYLESVSKYLAIKALLHTTKISN